MKRTTPMSEHDSTQPTPARGESDPAALDAVIKKFTSGPPDPGEAKTRERAEELAMGALVACYREDVPAMRAQLQALFTIDRYGAAILCAAEKLVSIVNDGIPAGSLRPEVLLMPNLETPPEAYATDKAVADWVAARTSAIDLLTGHATGNLARAERGKSALRSDDARALMVLTLLVRTAELRLARFRKWYEDGEYSLLEWKEAQGNAPE